MVGPFFHQVYIYSLLWASPWNINGYVSYCTLQCSPFPPTSILSPQTIFTRKSNMSALAMAAWMSSRCSCGAKGKASACPRGGIGRENKGDPRDIFDWRRSQGFGEDNENETPSSQTVRYRYTGHGVAVNARPGIGKKSGDKRRKKNNLPYDACSVHCSTRSESSAQG